MMRSLFIFAVFLMGCSFKPVSSVDVRVDFDGVSSYRESSMHSLIYNPNANLLQLPSSLGAFDCMGVNLVGPGIRSKHPNVSEDVFPATLAGASCSYPGISSGLMPMSGGSASLLAPRGPDRLLQVVGFITGNGCPLGNDGGDYIVSLDQSTSPWEVLELGRYHIPQLSQAMDIPIQIGYDSNNPRTLKCDPQTFGKNMIYIFDNAGGSELIRMFEVDGNTGGVTELGTGFDPGYKYEQGVVTADGKFLVAVGEDATPDALFRAFFLDDEGKITSAGPAYIDGPSNLPGKAIQYDAAHSRFYGIAGNGGDARIYSLVITDYNTGALGTLQGPFNVIQARDPADLVYHPLGGKLYATSIFNGQIVGWDVNTSNGQIGAQISGSPWADHGTCAAAVNTFGFRHNGTAVYSDCSTGLNYNQDTGGGVLSTSSYYPLPNAGSPTLKKTRAHPFTDWLYTAYVSGGSTVKVQASSFTSSGPLTEINTTPGATVTGFEDMAISEDGRFLYVLVYDSPNIKLTVFEIDGQSGALVDKGTTNLGGMSNPRMAVGLIPTINSP